MLEFFKKKKKIGYASIYESHITFNKELLKYFSNAYRVRVGIDIEEGILRKGIHQAPGHQKVGGDAVCLRDGIKAPLAAHKGETPGDPLVRQNRKDVALVVPVRGGGVLHPSERQRSG